MKINRKIICFPFLIVFLAVSTGAAIADDVNVEFVSHFGGDVCDVAVSGNCAYIGEGQDLIILDISDTTNPAEIGRLVTPSVIANIAVSGNYVYITDAHTGLFIADISEPTKPILSGSYNTTGDVLDVAVEDNYA